MSIKAISDVQASIFTVIKTDAGVQAFVGSSPARVYDHVPQGTDDFPYITIGDTTAVDASTKTEDGNEQTLTLHCWSRHQGHKEVWEMIEALDTALDGVSLTVSGNTPVFIFSEFADAFLDADGRTYHGAIRFRIRIDTP